MTYPVRSMTDAQILAALAGGDTHLEPVPRHVRIILPWGEILTNFRWDDPMQPVGLRRMAAVYAVRTTTEALDLLHELNWLPTLSPDARRWIIEETRLRPVYMATVLRAIRDTGLTLERAFTEHIAPMLGVHRTV